MFQMRILQFNFRKIDHVSNPNYTTWFYSRDVVIEKGNTHVRLIGHVNILCLACICVVRAFISFLHCGILSTGVVFLNRDNLETQASQYSLYLSFILEVEFVDILNYLYIHVNELLCFKVIKALLKHLDNIFWWLFTGYQNVNNLHKIPPP